MPPVDDSAAGRDAAQRPPVSSAGIPVRSAALAANLQRTAVQVQVPEWQASLLEILAGHHGLRSETEVLLQELNHPYAGWPQALADLQHRAMSDFPTANLEPRGDEALAIYSGLFRHLTERPLPPDLRSEALQGWTRFLDMAVRVSQPHLERNAGVLEVALEELSAAIGTRSAAPALTSDLRQLLDSVAAARGEVRQRLLPPAAATYGRQLDELYAGWLRRTDACAWGREAMPEPEAELGPVQTVGHGQFRQYRRQLAELSGAGVAERVGDLLALPDQRRLARAYLEATDHIAASTGSRLLSLRRQVRWLSRLVGEEALGAIHDRALNDIRRAAVEFLRDAPPVERKEFLAEFFEALPQERLHGSQSAFQLITAVGQEVLSAEDDELVDAFCDHVLDLDFERPDFEGFTTEWKPRVNPGHLANVRALLNLITASPAAARRLLSGLIIHLRTSGIFLADTDLFQKDVSRLLAADVGPVYQQIKTLMRLFPVYFSEIGAEGDLRDVSTRIDEIEQRRDLLSHFLRKQCHVESNARILYLVEEIARFWAGGESDRLRDFLPAAFHHCLSTDSDHYGRVHAVMSRLVQAAGGTAALLDRDAEWVDTRVDTMPDVDAAAREKARLLLRLHRLLEAKYGLDHSDLLDRLRAFGPLGSDRIDRFAVALAAGQDETALDELLDIMAALKEIVLSKAPTEAIENIYHKRHIAVGIPSMYGQYQEPRFEAMGLILRAECQATVLMERLVDDLQSTYMTRRRLHDVQRLLALMVRALRLEGFEAQGLSMGLSMLEQALANDRFTVDQYVNVVQFLARALSFLIRARFIEVYEPDLHRILRHAIEREHLGAADRDPREALLKASESFFRDLIASAFGPQQADMLVGNTLRALAGMRENLGADSRNRVLSFDPQRAILALDDEHDPHDGRFLLGYKGFMVKRMARLGMPTPPGFIITTESFRCRESLYSHPALRSETAETVRRHLGRIEERTGRRLGDPARPLFLSVRSGAPISMPGMMDTFLNVGMTPRIVESFADSPDRLWAGWDAYRRFLQFWGMSFGMPRDLFDRRMRQAKERAAVPKKALIPPDDMRRVAQEYAELLADHDVSIPDDPFRQLMQCIALVQASWNSEKARIYRREMQIAEEWGTAVIVQQMVFGNLSPESGTGVFFTRNPRGPAHRFELYGDYILQSQGDDVVGGLVETIPITERQRLQQQSASCLEAEFPEIFATIERLAKALVLEHGLPHQEIEFTFEGPRPDQVYLLQTRDMAFFQPSSVPTFVPSPELDAAKLGSGIGVGGGALSGRVAYSEADVKRFKGENADEAVIVLRPDTVPDDIPIILQAEGLLTSLGGSTSHAAVAAQALGRTCVVGCRGLMVDEERGLASMGGREIRAGDYVSINGIDGSVYSGKHPTTIAPRRGLV